MDRVEDIQFEDEGLKVALYGRSGTGKTTLCSTFPKPILWIVCSGGKRSGELRSIKNTKGVKKFELQDTEELPKLCKELQESNEFKTVILDHATYLQDLRMKEILELDEVAVQKSWGMATREDYGQCSQNMKTFFRYLLDLKANVVIVAQEREFKSGEEDEVMIPFVGTALSPSVTGWLNPSVDYLLQTFIRGKTKRVKKKVGKKTIQKEVRVDGVEYCLRTGAHEIFMTKFRVPKGHKLPEVVVDPDYNKLMEIIQG